MKELPRCTELAPPRLYFRQWAEEVPSPWNISAPHLAATQLAGEAKLSFLSAAEAADVDWYLGGVTNDAVRNPQPFRNDPTKKATPQRFKPPLWYGRAVGGGSPH